MKLPRPEIFLLFYCVMAFVNLPQWQWFHNAEFVRLLDWCINDMSHFAREALPYFFFAFLIDVGWIRNLFWSYLALNFLTIGFDYLFAFEGWEYHAEWWYECIFRVPKVIILVIMSMGLMKMFNDERMR